MKVTIVPIVIGAFGTITKVILKGLVDLDVGRRVETIQMKALLTAGYKLSRSQEKINHLMYMDDIKLFAKK